VGGVRASDLGFGAWGSGFRFQGIRFRAWGLGFRI
jgi:hypothetical protein